MVEATSFLFEKHVIPTTVSLGIAVWLGGDDRRTSFTSEPTRGSIWPNKAGAIASDKLESDVELIIGHHALGKRVGILAALGALLSSTAVSAAGPSAGGLAPPPSMSAGGLAPPAQPASPYGQPLAPPPGSLGAPANTTQARLDEAGASDSGRGLDYVYFDVEAGLQLVAARRAARERTAAPFFFEPDGRGAAVRVGLGATPAVPHRGATLSLRPLQSLQSLDTQPRPRVARPLGNGTSNGYAVFSAGYAHLGEAGRTTRWDQRAVSPSQGSMLGCRGGSITM